MVTSNKQNEEILASVRLWVESVVVELNLCPFAKRELVNQRVRFFVSEAASEQKLLVDLLSELTRLEHDPDIETTLLILPHVLQDFCDYNQFLDYVDNLLEHHNWVGVFQVASFHPDYQFGGTEVDDEENYTNRSPYPVLHLLREASLEKAIEHYGDVDEIPERNVALMKKLGKTELAAMLEACFGEAAE